MATQKNNEKNLDKNEIINYQEYSNDIEKQKEELNSKINILENKLIDLEIKENMINNIITRTNATLENIDPGNFKWIGQTQSNLMKQIESLGMVKDIIIKYEDLIMKYRKMIIDIDEKKMVNRLKIASLQKEEEEKETALTEVLSEVQEIFKNTSGSEVIPNFNDPNNPQVALLSSLHDELKQEGY